MARSVTHLLADRGAQPLEDTQQQGPGGVRIFQRRVAAIFGKFVADADDKFVGAWPASIGIRAGRPPMAPTL